MSDRRDDREHEEATLLIPWYVTGQLDPEDEALVARHSQTSADCREEIERERELSRMIAAGSVLAEDDEAAADRGWQALSAQIARERAALEPKREGGLSALLGRLGGGLRLPVAGAALVGVAALVLVLVWDRGGPAPETSPAGYETLTSGGEAADGRLRLKVAPDTAPGRVAEIAAELGLAVVDGPSVADVYTLAPVGAGDMGAAEAALADYPEVLFVTGGAGP